MGRFASTVAYYESARPPYGAAFFEAVALAAWPGRESAPARCRRRPGHSGDRLCALLPGGRRRRSGAGDGRGRARGGRTRRRHGEVHRGQVRGRRREARRIRHCQYRPRDPLARSRACPSGARPRPRPSWKGSGLRRYKRQRRAQPVARDLQRGARSLEGRSTVARSSTRSSPTASSPEPERSGSRGPMPFRSSVWSNACCRCRPHRRSGSATKFR